MKTCLIVDDSEVVRKVLKRIIEDLGYFCLEAENGEDAYDKCRAQMPDAITLDWNMPVMDGMAFVQKLRRTAGGDRPKVIFCSTENNAQKIKAALDAGADDYVMKPFDAAIIRTKFRLCGLVETL